MARCAMTSRERVLAAINHEPPDRVPLHCLGFQDLDPLFERFGVGDWWELQRALELDVAWLAPEYVGPELAEGMTVWGTKSIADNSGYSESRGGHPFAEIESVRDVESYCWPSADDYDYAGLRLQFERAGSLARSFQLGWQPIFCRMLDLFGMQSAMIALHTHPVLIEATVSHVADFCLAATERGLEACAGLVDIYWYGDDFATQRGLMISPEHWRRFFAPTYRRIFRLAKSYGVKMWFHSCGSLIPVMPDLIDMGMDVWETCQAHLVGNDPSTLKRRFGKHIAFYGAINTQSTLPFGTVADVRREVRERIAVLGQGGGYICGPDHTVMRGTPVENVLAWLDEAKAYADPRCVA